MINIVMSAETGWIYHDTYEKYMQDFKLLVKLADGKINNYYNIPLPCSPNKKAVILDQLIFMHIHGRIEKTV